MNNKPVYERGEVRLGLERMQRLMSLLDNPQNKIPAIHIAGTNGKGSTGTFIKSALMSAGLRVGHYQTPAVFESMEIISINGENISREEFGCLCDELDIVINQNMSDDKPSSFERDTAAAFLYFERMNCDISIIEVGLGGDTDATNVINCPQASVITPVGFDHTEFLGRTLEEIAGHKAGIIKPGSVVITAAQCDEVMRVIKSRAEEEAAELIIAGELDVRPHYQSINAGVAYETLKVLRRTWPGISLAKDNLRKQFEASIPFGRFSQLGDDPIFIIDGAHNLPAARELRRALDESFGDADIIYITGAFKDKDYINVIKAVVKNGEKIITVTAPGARGLAADSLAQELEQLGMRAVAAADIAEAVENGCRQAALENKAVAAFGSLSWLKEAKEEYDNWKCKYTG